MKLARIPPVLFAAVCGAGLLLSGCTASTSEDQVGEVPVPGYLATLKPHLKKRYNSEVAFFVDLTRSSNQERFFVLDLQRNRVLAKGLCCNGRTDAQGKVRYSNVKDSNCSSRGAAKVSYAYNGQFGKAYKLEGLEPSNSNMFARAVVLHAHGCVPATSQDAPICVSKGCPTVNPVFLETLAGYIDPSPKPILLYIQ